MTTTLTIPDIEPEEFMLQITDTMNIYDYNPDESDYLCGFCLKRPRTNLDLIKHSPTCLGEKLLKAWRNTP